MKNVIILTTLFILVFPSVSRGDYHEAIKKGHYKAALNELRPLAEKGDAIAQYNLAIMYTKGQGLPQDYTEAAKWYQKAADQGNSDAQFLLGYLYYEGQRVPQDYTEAIKWFHKAAYHGDAIAQVLLGDIYADDQGAHYDYVQAHMWYNLAAANGSKYASGLRERVAKKMTPAQIAEAQKLAREFMLKLKESKSKK